MEEWGNVYTAGIFLSEEKNLELEFGAVTDPVLCYEQNAAKHEIN
jgi:hypothetical protein